MLKTLGLAVAALLISACAEEPEDTPDAAPAPSGDLGVYTVETAYDSCDAPVVLELELDEGGAARITQDGHLWSTPWGVIGDTPWLLDLNLLHKGLLWSANPLKLERRPEGGFVGAIAWHSEIGPWCRGTIRLTRSPR